MKVRVPHYYDEFKCTGSRCPDTCCVGWMIEIDDDSYERFMNMEGEFGERIRANIIQRPDGRFFGMNEDGRCIFLNENNLCDMVIKLGESSLCSLCDNYPRVGEEYGSLREMGLSLSCPEVSRMVLSMKEPVRFGEWFLDEEPQGRDYAGDMLFRSLLASRDVIFGILQDRELTISERASLYMMFAARLQNILDSEKTEKEMTGLVEKLNEKFLEDGYTDKAKNSVKMASYASARRFMMNVYSMIDNMEIINDRWQAIHNTASWFLDGTNTKEYEELNKEFDGFNSEYAYIYEHMMVYYVYRYFLKMISDGDIYSKAVMCVVSVAAIHEAYLSLWIKNNKSLTMQDRINVSYLYSKEIEHCEENMEAMADEFWEEDMYGTDSVIENIARIL